MRKTHILAGRAIKVAKEVSLGCRSRRKVPRISTRFHLYKCIQVWAPKKAIIIVKCLKTIT